MRHNGYDVLKQHGYEHNSYPYDYAFLPYVDGNRSVTWLENHPNRNRVLKYCRNGGMDSNSDTPCGDQATSVDEYILGYHPLSAIKKGWVACATGSASHPTNYPDAYGTVPTAGYLVGTRCGRVLDPDGLGINTDICARPGDSGGPLFSQIDSRAYGILEGHQQNRTGACYAGERNNYTAISKIYDGLLTKYGPSVDIEIITTHNG